jgi:flagellar basal-body rod protein FlgF/flagellar basal-body rod protein FlgG
VRGLACLFSNTKRMLFKWLRDCTRALAMDPSLLIAAAGLRAQMETLELLGNNIANLGTAGFKGDREFLRLFRTELAGQAGPGEARWMPVVQGSAIDFSQGPLTPTENPLDIALSGSGFFVAAGADGARLYTRNGAFRLSSSGRLETAEGHAVLDGAGAPITLPRSGEIQVAETGMIRVNGLDLAQLGVVDFSRPSPLAKQGHSYFVAPPETLTAPAVGASVRQGFLEGSNVQAPLAAIQLIQANRQFEMLSRIAALVANEMNGRAVEQLGSIR